MQAYRQPACSYREKEGQNIISYEQQIKGTYLFIKSEVKRKLN